LAAVQVESRNFDVAGNLARAEGLVARAAERGAELVVCPELMAAGYVYDRAIWDVAERRGGATELWLASMARQHRIYIGASYLEACGEDFYNTFALMKPDGEVAGRVRKESLPGFEGWFFRSCRGSKVIETEIGRIGVGICHDTNTSRFMRGMSEERVDLLVMPHCAPSIRMGPMRLVGEEGRETLRGVAGFYAETFGIPTVMVNKAAGADSDSPVPWVPLVRFRFHFMGQSTICDGEGKVCGQLEEEEGVVAAEVELDPKLKRRAVGVPSGYWSRRPPMLASFPRIAAGVFRGLEELGRTGYRVSGERRAMARRCGREMHKLRR
jgi:N-carbamoylputrescine amidase